MTRCSEGPSGRSHLRDTPRRRAFRIRNHASGRTSTWQHGRSPDGRSSASAQRTPFACPATTWSTTPRRQLDSATTTSTPTSSPSSLDPTSSTSRTGLNSRATRRDSSNFNCRSGLPDGPRNAESTPLAWRLRGAIRLEIVEGPLCGGSSTPVRGSVRIPPTKDASMVTRKSGPWRRACATAWRTAASSTSRGAAARG